MKRLIEVLKRIKLLNKQNWAFTDYFIESKNIIHNQVDPTNPNNDEEFTCIRNYDGFSIYLDTNSLDNFYNNKGIYNKDYELINISELRRRRKARQVLANVYNKISPATVNLKVIETIKLEGINSIYLVCNMNLGFDDPLYTDLVNYTKIEEKY